jgi:hypothetical protein
MRQRRLGDTGPNRHGERARIKQIRSIFIVPVAFH